VTTLNILSKYLLVIELRFDAILYSNMGNENSVAGHIKYSRGPQVPHPCSITSYNDYDQTSTTIQHSIKQPCSESVKFDIK